MSQLNLTKLINQVSRYIKNGTADITTRHSAVSSIIGAVIGTQLDIPVTKVTNMRVHYQSNLYPTVSNWVSQINEAHDIDIDLALECAFLTWVDRYKVVHAPALNVTLMLSRLCANVGEGNSNFDNKRLLAIDEFLQNTDTAELNAILLELMNQLKED